MREIFFLQLSGVPGSGKTTLALEIAKDIDVIIIDHDITKSALMQSGLDAKTAGIAAFDVGYAYVNFYLSQGRNVIIDSCCFYDRQLTRGMDAVISNNAKYKYIECYLNNFNEIIRRVQSRKKKSLASLNPLSLRILIFG